MNERERDSFRMVFLFCDKWRSVVIETQEQWEQFAADVGQLGRDLDIDHNQLGWRLMEGAVEYFNDLYRNGMKPVPAGFFGRDDLST